ncbi:MAG: hypothetical protein U5L11_03210 [Arhodomonas sp.]|nr:hypothetical protein [Arhodomonas sp.]
MLAIARALMAKRPQLMLLDEPSMGLAPLLVAEIFRIVERLKEEGITVLLVEQNACRCVGPRRLAATCIETGRHRPSPGSGRGICWRTRRSSAPTWECEARGDIPAFRNVGRDPHGRKRGRS